MHSFRSFRFPAGAPYPVTFTFRSSVPSSRRMFCNALRSRWYISKFCLLSDNSPSVFSPFFLLPFAKVGDGPRHCMQCVFARCRLDESSPRPGISCPYPCPRLKCGFQAGSACRQSCLRRPCPVCRGRRIPCVLIRSRASFIHSLWGTATVSEGARHPGVVPYHYCGYGGRMPVSGKFLLPLVHFSAFPCR